MKKPGSLIHPYLLMLLLLVVWGSFAAISKLVLRSIDSFQVLFYMFGFALLAMTILFAVTGRLKPLLALPIRDVFKLLLFALPSFLYYLFYTLALRLIPAVEASMLNYLFPLMIVIFAVPINGERIDGRMVVAILMGLLGMVIIVTNGKLDAIRMSNLAGDLLALGAAACWGIFSNLGKRNRADTTLSNYVYVLAAFVLSVISLFVFSKPVLPALPTDAGLLWLGLSNIVVAYYLWFKALKITSAARMASLAFITPFITLLFIALLLGEKISLVQVAGLLVILAGLAVQSRFGYKDQNQM